MAKETLIFQNNTVVFTWLVIGFFNIGVIAMTYMLLRDGFPKHSNTLFSMAMAGFFWLAAIGSSIWALRLKRVRLEISVHTAKLTISSLLKKEIYDFSARDVKRIEMVTSSDSDGDPYFIVSWRLSKQEQFASSRAINAG